MDDKEVLDRARTILKNPRLYAEFDVRNANTFLAAWSEGRADQVPFCGMILPDKPRVSHTEEEQ
jgi:hypothetical protein